MAKRTEMEPTTTAPLKDDGEFLVVPDVVVAFCGAT